MTELSEGQCTLNTNIAKQLLWRRNSPYLYQTLLTGELSWPSLTVQWWFDAYANKDNSCEDQTNTCFITYGTHTNNEEKNYLVLAKVYLPNQQYIDKHLRYKGSKPSETIKLKETISQKIVVQHQIQHEGEINRIKHHPKQTNLIATRTPLGEVHIFDKFKFKSGKIKLLPSFVLSGHQSQGYSLEWNPHKQGQIIAGSYDGKLTLWDINLKQTNSTKINPLCYFNFHDKQIEDITHNIFHDCVFASCDDQGRTAIWDTRNSHSPVHHMRMDQAPLYSVQFSPLNCNLFATAGAQSTIKLWDMRNLTQNLFQYKQATNQQIIQLKWSSQQKQILWSVSGNKATMWDLNEGKPKFVHGGHSQSINQIDLHPQYHQTVASVDINNELHVFQPSKNACSSTL